MRWVSTRVLPDPAPATMSSGPPVCVTAARCSGFRSSSSAAAASGTSLETEVMGKLSLGAVSVIRLAVMTDVPLRTEDGLDLPARWWHAADPRAVVVLVHGFTASKDDPALAATAERLQDAGYDVVSYDARGHGQSAGLSTLGDLERHDVAAAVGVTRALGLPVVLVGA